MVLSTGTNKIKTAVFISGTGSNLKSLIKFTKLNKSLKFNDYICTKLIRLTMISKVTIKTLKYGEKGGLLSYFSRLLSL